MANLQREVVDRNAELLARPARRTEVTENLDIGEDGAPGYYNSFWLDEGTTSTGRTSIIVDPSYGRIPPLTPEGQRGGGSNRWRNVDRAVPWAHPAFANGHVIARNDAEVVRMSLTAADYE